jgi:hypothetical protein
MTRRYYTVIVFIDKDNNPTKEPEIVIDEVEEEDLPPMYVTIAARYIAIHTFHQVYMNAKIAADDARRRWKAGAFNDVLNAIIAEIIGYKTTDNQEGIKP